MNRQDVGTHESIGTGDGSPGGSDGRGERRGGRGAVLVAVGLAVAGLVPLGLVAQPSSDPASAGWPWALTGALVLLLAAALWVPAARWVRWPAADRRASVRAVAGAVPLALVVIAVATVVAVALVLLVDLPNAAMFAALWQVPLRPTALQVVVPGVVALVYAGRRVTPLAAEVWAARRHLPPATAPLVRTELRRLRLWRTVPAVTGAAFAVAPSIAYDLALDVLGTPPSDQVMALLDRYNVWPLDPLTLALAGYLLGATVGEATRRRPAPGPDGSASLEVRTPAAYLTGWARWLAPAFAAVAVVAGLVAWARFGVLPDAPLAVAVVLAAGVAGIQRWVVRRPQRGLDGGRLLLDDVLRSSAAHATAGAAGALLLVLAIASVQRAVMGPEALGGGVLGLVLGLAAIFGVIALWLGYGSGHRGRVPARPAASVRR
ncbi:hypothetical protein [Egicoccus halophilus]|uniref:Uncharacterized protein n=1 Tax=Egicoccus halophilus TaxID=1670830 RepID=A0A8J3ES90_9ACTN|nr:hypothetical protein [Egicoccus halophilus]GGI06821.1 hypothetical protein GCM10011354_21010 [Egicoccus halophilus]